MKTKAGFHSLCTCVFVASFAGCATTSQSPIDDVSTQRFIGRYYEALARGAGAADALMEAQTWMRAQPDTRAPFFWAGFVLIGDGAVAPALEPRRGMSLPIWIAVGMTLVLAVVAIARRRRAPLDRSGGAL